MAAAYSQDLRDRVLAAYDRGMATGEIAEVFAVSPAWARRVRQRRRDFGETAPRKVGSPGVPHFDRQRLAELVRERPDATAPELRALMGVECSDSAIYQALKKLGFTFKKRQSTRRSRTGPMSRRGGRTGAAARTSLTPAASYSSTRPGPKPT